MKTTIKLIFLLPKLAILFLCCSLTALSYLCSSTSGTIKSVCRLYTDYDWRQKF